MSLTTQLHGGELAAWCVTRFVATHTAAAEVAAAARDHRPVRPAGRVGARHWADIGGAFGLRLAAAVEASPPYYPLYGLVRAGIVTRRWADDQASRWPTHTALPAVQRHRALEMRPIPGGGWLDLGTPPAAAITAATPPPPTEGPLADLFGRFRRYLAEHAPPGQLGTPGVEAGLARVLWLVSQCEDAYRSGRPTETLHRLFGGRSVPTVEAMRAAAPEPVVVELVELVGRLRASEGLDKLRYLAGSPPAGRSLGHAAPVFAHHWADGDLLLSDGRASTLLDVKTVIRVDAERTARWLWQLLGYAWLDTADRWRIRTVGLLLARHGVVVDWPVDELAARLLGVRGISRHRQVAKARGEFLAVAGRVLIAEGARLT